MIIKITTQTSQHNDCMKYNFLIEGKLTQIMISHY